MLSFVELLVRVRATLGSPLFRNECRQTDRAWYGSMSLWINVAVLGFVSWGFVLFVLWWASQQWWLVAAPLALFLIQAPTLASAPDLAVLLRRERRQGTLENLVLTTADRQDLLWAKVVTALRANLVGFLSYLPLGILAGALVWARSPESADQAPWTYALGGLVLGALTCVAGLGASLTVVAISTRVALSRWGFIGQLVLAMALAIPLGTIDLLCIAAPMAGLLATWRSSLAAFPSSVTDQALGNLLAVVGLGPGVLRATGVRSWLFCGAALLVLRLVVLNLWLPLRLLRRCADRFEERLLREERG